MVKSKIGIFLSLPFLVILSLFFASASAVLAFIDSVVNDVLWVRKRLRTENISLLKDSPEDCSGWPTKK